jgi:tetratricopeptide (TPR) repeat protein
MLSVLFFVFCSVAQTETVDSLVLRGLDAAYCEDYEEAKEYVRKAIELDPENPLVWFAYSGIFRIYTSDFVTDSLLDSFFLYADRTAEMARKKLQRDRNDAWAYFFLGSVSMYKSSIYIEKGSLIKALGYAEGSVRDIERCLEVDPDIFDGYLVMGSYEYLKGMFPLWSSYKKRGIEKVRIASRKGKYSRPMSQNILSILLLREEEYSEALSYARGLVDRYPESRTFRWTLCKSYGAVGDWERAIENYRILLSSILTDQPFNTYNIIQVHLSLAQAYYRGGYPEDAIEMCTEIEERDDKSEGVRRMVSEAEELRKRIEEERGK